MGIRLWMLVSFFSMCCFGVLLSGCAIEEVASGEEFSADSKAAASNVELAIGYMRLGKNGIAMQKLQKALDQNYSSPSAHHYIAVLYDRLGQNDMASRHFKKAVRLDPDNSRMRNNYGQYLCRQHQYEEAERNFKQALANPLYDSRALVYTNAGICAQLSGDSVKAENYFRQSLQLQPDFGAALFQMMHLSYHKKRFLQARGYLQRYQSVSPVSAESLYMGVQIERALGNESEAAVYNSQLRGKYPESAEALKAMTRN